MANWCYNIVSFEGETTAIKELQTLFEKLARQEEKQHYGQLPKFRRAEDGYLFSIRWEDGTLYYETKWSPNTKYYESDVEILEILLERKQQQLKNNQHDKSK